MELRSRRFLGLSALAMCLSQLDNNRAVVSTLIPNQSSLESCHGKAYSGAQGVVFFARIMPSRAVGYLLWALLVAFKQSLLARPGGETKCLLLERERCLEDYAGCASGAYDYRAHPAQQPEAALSQRYECDGNQPG